MKKEAKRAATLVLVKDSDEGLQTLLLRRHKQLKVGSGSWVFPGGAIDPEDGLLGEQEQHTAMVAALRETQEEAGLDVPLAGLQFLSHWTTPSGYPFRFATWFFVTEGSDAPVKVDGEEMDDFLWASPAHFLRCHEARQMLMLPPTVVTLCELAACENVAAVRAFYANREAPFIEPVKANNPALTCMMYPGDAGFESADDSLPGPKNRCYLDNDVWRYVCCPE